MQVNIFSNTDNKYPALKIISELLRIAAWITAISAAIGALFALSELQLIPAISVVIFGGFMACLQFAIAESVIVLCDIEYNTRKKS